MSSPSLGEASLDPETRKRLEESRRKEKEELEKALKKYFPVCDKVRRLKENALASFARCDPVFAAEIKKRMDILLGKISVVTPVARISSSYYAAIKAMEDACAVYGAELESLLERALYKTESLAKNKAAAERAVSDNISFQTFAHTLDSKDAKAGTVKINFGSVSDEKELTENLTFLRSHFLAVKKDKSFDELEKFAEKAADKLGQIIQMKKTPELYGKIRGAMQKLIDEEQDIIRRREESDLLYISYHAAAVMAGRTPKAPEDFKSAAGMKSETVELYELCAKNDEMDFIAEKLNEVMSDMGYSLVSSAVLTREDRESDSFRSADQGRTGFMKNENGDIEYSLYRESENSGISVYTGQSGEIMMCPAVIGESRDITDADRELSFQKQIDFCSRHRELTKALEEKGVILKRKFQSPPDRDMTFKEAAAGADDIKQVDRRSRRRRRNDKKMREM